MTIVSRMETSIDSGMQVVTTPTFNWLADKASASKTRVLIGSPYVNDAIIQLTDLIPSGVSQTLVTKTDIRDFRLGASNLNSLRSLAKKRVAIRSLIGLHAKIYVFDDSAALVTSANATHGGMRRNLECGLATNDTQLVNQISRSLIDGLGSDNPPRKVSLAELNGLMVVLDAIQSSTPSPAVTGQVTNDPPVVEAKFAILDEDRLLTGLRGWLRLTMTGVLTMPEDGFALRDLLEVCEPVAANEYPKNQHVGAKLRQQLQNLRDLGLVEFVRPGYYRRTMHRHPDK